ncbi:MAG: inorganic pyrophosphatase [Pseudomonadota bacterium]
MTEKAGYAFHRPHPWHGLSPGEHAPEHVNVFVEMTPFDHVKYEIDKSTGFIHVDRPQRTTAQMPCLYGFIPQTYCAERVSALSPRSTRGDGDPIDICVVSERPINRAEITLNAWVVGGLQMVDGGEADDKIVAILDGDFVHGHIRDIHDLPTITIERIRHYFLTYKMKPGQTQPVTGVEPYGRDHALKVIEASIADYADHFGEAKRAAD